MCALLFSYVICFFFFFKQKTAYEMRISDWSSDVCSSDLGLKEVFPSRRPDGSDDKSFPSGHTSTSFAAAATLHNRYGWEAGLPAYEIGRASCRERVCQYV